MSTRNAYLEATCALGMMPDGTYINILTGQPVDMSAYGDLRSLMPKDADAKDQETTKDTPSDESAESSKYKLFAKNPNFIDPFAERK